MKLTIPPLLQWIVAGILGAGTFLFAGGCSSEPSTSAVTPQSQSLAQSPGAPAPGQPVFATDADAVHALLAAVKGQDHDQVHHLLGPAWKELTSGDTVEDADDFKDFAARADQQMRIEKKDDSLSMLRVGKDNWLMPIPIVRDSSGKWFFDTEAGKSEVLARRIGQNELEAIQICRLYVKAQHEFAARNRDSAGGFRYAEKILSTPGQQDGLYWNAAAGQQQSPLGRLIAEEKMEGYLPERGKHMPYRGYKFRILKRQGPNAPGGKMDYRVNGKMTAGFALIAYPAAYESSGIMTFLVNQDGKIYQKDLGPETAAIAHGTREYDPDSSWTLVKD